MNIMPDLSFPIIHNPFTNEMISVYLDNHSHMSLKLNTNEYSDKLATSLKAWL